MPKDAGEQDRHLNVSNCEHANGNGVSGRPFLARLHAFIDHLVRHIADAEEVFQETLLRAWKAHPDEQWQEAPSERLQRWLVVVARRLAINLMRRRESHPEQSLDALPSEWRDCCAEGTAGQERKEQRLAFLRAEMEHLHARYPVTCRLLRGHVMEGDTSSNWRRRKV